MKLALANIRKGKSAMVSLFVFILVAAVLLNIGLMVMTQINAFFDHKVEQLKDPHVTIMMDDTSNQAEYEAFIANYPGVSVEETENIIKMNMAKFDFGNGELSNSVILFNADAKRDVAPLQLIEKRNTTSNSDDEIYVPYSFKNGGYTLGDHFTITYQNKKYEYQIAGFFETTMMGTSNIGMMKFMLPEKSYDKLLNELDDQSEGMMISAIMDDQTQSAKLETEFMREFQRSTGEETIFDIESLNIDLVKSVNTLTINIVATILVTFAAIIVLISLIVIRFRVSSSIEDGMVNIGVLKAIGYTSRQILLSIILQFILVSLSASIVGIAVSYGLMPFFGEIISSLSGLIWSQSFDITMNLVSIFFVAFCVITVTLLSAITIRKILPVSALRGGVKTHNFRRNHFPLEKAKGSLHFLLAMKSMLVHAKQNIMILLITIALTFASIFSMVLYYNIASDKTAFINLFGSEPANVYIMVQSDANIKELMSNFEKMDHVEKLSIFDLIQTKIDGQTAYTNVTEDYDQLENNIVYEGRQPKYENEIAISWVISSQINKGIGDTVELKYGDETGNFLITGLSQSIGNAGQIAALTMEGMQQLHSNYQGSTLYVYLDGISNKDFIDNVQEEYGGGIAEMLDIDENIESQTGMYTAAVFALMLMVLAITVVVVVMILYLVIKTVIIKRKQEFGVMKAIGYSTIQLMNQISISFLPIIITGVVIGGILGYFFTNPILSVLLSSAGVKRLDFIVHFPIILMVCVGILILAYIVSMFVSRKIKKISAYGLMAE